MVQEKTIKEIKLDNEPHILTRCILFNDDLKNIKDKNKKQFITCTETTLEVLFSDNTILKLYAPKSYCFDGATIPFGIGKGNMKLQIPALFHDIMCDNKQLINYNRKLSSEIFRELLIKCKVNKYVAHGMYFIVDNYQKLMDWKIK